MTEPTNHRAEAEHWLNLAQAGGQQGTVVSAALIGIGHALLAQPPAPPKVPQRFMCPTCEGRGWIPDNADGREDCPNCHGDGYVMRILDHP